MHDYRNHQEQRCPSMCISYPSNHAEFVVDVLHTGISFLQLRFIKQGQNRAGKNLNNQEEKRDPPKVVVPMRLFNFHKSLDYVGRPYRIRAATVYDSF